MLTSFNSETFPNIANSQNVHNIANGYGSKSQSNIDDQNKAFQERKNSNGTNGSNKAANSYATDYLNTVRENRSMYGNYVDNALAFDPHKEKKSVYNVVYETDEYNPWGKPGGGAPKLDTNTGQLSTKIRGTLKWNLTGETEDDRMNRMLNSSQKQKSNQNLLLYKKGSSPPISPRQPTSESHRQATTYNYNYRDPYLASNTSLENLGSNQKLNTVDPLRPPADYLSQAYSNSANPNMNSVPRLPPVNSKSMHQNGFQTSIEREAAERQDARLMTKSNSFASRPKAGVELNRISNKLYNDNQPTYDYPNNPYWFGRTGPHSKTSIGMSAFNDPFYHDARRHKLLDALENRTPRSYGNSNDYHTASAQAYSFNSPRSIYGPSIPSYPMGSN